ncbi:DUF2637 domain-containing protein [Spirillospora albida]|uniref:DUF2637 domain-containing protein n=1 Tax=Spirillospora albida TaxID=58123 RepID=UPI0004C1E486|nr:DUF2637 domain-containing protein [Spirillospora albida]
MASDEPRPDPSGPHFSPGRRLALVALAGLVVAALAGGAYTLTYGALRDLAEAGGAGERWSHVHPIMVDTLTALAILSLVVARHARWWTRLLRWTLLLLLTGGVAAAAVQHSVWGYGEIPRDPLRAGVAVAPQVMLVIAVWLWLTMVKHIRVAARTGPGAEPVTTQRGHVKLIEAPDESRPELDSQPDRDPQPELDPLPRPLAITAPPAAPPTDVEVASRRPDAKAPEESDDDDLPIWDWDPPSSTFRSSPTPPTE